MLVEIVKVLPVRTEKKVRRRPGKDSACYVVSSKGSGILFYGCVEGNTYKGWTWLFPEQTYILKGGPGFFLLLIVKRERKQLYWRENFLNKKETRLDDLGTSHLVQIAKNGKVRRPTHHWRERSQRVRHTHWKGNPFANATETRCLTHGSL